MLGRIFTQFGQYPGRTSVVVLLSISRIGFDLLTPWLASEGANAEDEDYRYQSFELFAGAFAAARVIPLVQKALLVEMGTDLATKLTRETSHAFFRIPETVADTEKGETHEFVNQYGACAQPGGIGHSVLPVFVDSMTDLSELIALHVCLGMMVGQVTWLPAVQTGLYFATSAFFPKQIADRVINYLQFLYLGFSKAIVYTNDYVVNILFNRQNIAVKELPDYLEKELHPTTHSMLYMNLAAMTWQFLVGGAVLVAELAYLHDEQNDQNNKHFILLLGYSMLLMNLLTSLMSNTINGIGGFGMFFTLLQYVSKGLELGTEVFVIDEAEGASLEIKNISYQYPVKGENKKDDAENKKLFSDFSLKINAGDVVAFTGPNGCGKSTLFKMISTFLRPDKGNILLSGKDVAVLNPSSTLSLCAYVSQKSEVVRGSFRININDYWKDAPEEAITKVMQEVGLSPRFSPNDIIRFGFGGAQLSGGEKQRVVIARALLGLRSGKVKYLFFDEGLTALDPVGEENILQLLQKELQEKNITAVLITHHLARMQQVLTFDKIVDVSTGAVEECKAEADKRVSVSHQRHSSALFQPVREKEEKGDQVELETIKLVVRQ